MQRRRFVTLAAAAASFAAVPGASLLARAAEPYPDKPIRLIVPYAAGGGVDNISRVVGQYLGLRLKQTMVIDNRPGANANIGSDAVAKAAPDGYTLLMGSTYLCFNRATMKSMTYDSATDLVPIARTGRAPFVLAVSSTATPAKTVAELVAYMKANPDKASYGAVGVGAPTNLLFAKNSGTQPIQVLYKGGAAAMPDLIEGRVTFMIQTASEILPLVSSGKLRALAVTGPERFAHLPDVPTFKEAGVPHLENIGWWGLFAPAKTPAAIVQKLSDETQLVLAMPEVVAAFDRLGIDSAPMTSTQFATFYRDEQKTAADVAKEFNLVID